ncbi:MAG: tetratricopeptide repeat protein [Cyanobacteriota bacterium]|nr:tetratricopeptide repeat protein [Cyanobacteriota bacterium]
MRSPQLSAERSSPVRITAEDLSFPKVVGWNRQVYQRLKLSFQLGLRRQIFIAVCDDLTRRDSLAARLQSELSPDSSASSPQFVSLRLNLSDPNPIAQVNQWLAQHRTSLRSNTGFEAPGFQIVGVEQLTRQPAAVQWSFLNGLRQIREDLPQWEPSLLLWVSRPWLHSIEQSAPEFWRCCTGVFEFQGEPTGPDNPIARQPAQQKMPKQSRSTPSQETGEETSQPTLDFSFSHLDREFVKRVLATLDLARASTWEPLQILQRLERLYRQDASPIELADGYQQLGDIYRDRLKQKKALLPEIRVAICAYDRARESLTAATSPSPEQMRAISVELGGLYSMLSRSSAEVQEKCGYLTKSLEFYREAREDIDRQHPMWTQVQINLGEAYADLARYENAAENLGKSAVAFEEVLQNRDCQIDPEQYAIVQNSLGTTYWSLAQHREPMRYLQQAIAAYCQALEIYTPERNAIDYAMVQNNLGTAYWTRSKHDRPRENLRLAIEAYRAALQHRTPETLPIGCATTQNNLATAYWHLARQFEGEPEKAEYLQEAIAAYETAITVAELVGRKTLPFDRYAAHHNLGLVYSQWVANPHFDRTAEVRQKNLEAALHHHSIALDGWQQQPERYQRALDAIVQTIRGFYNDGDIQGQNSAFSKLPTYVLPEVMKRL